MRDVSDVPHTVHSTSDDPPYNVLRPKTPLPTGSRTLHRTISCASIDTIRPSGNKGIRRSINEIAQNLKNKSAKKSKKQSTTQDVAKCTTHDPASDSKAQLPSKATLRGRKATAPLRNSSHRSEEESVLAIADRLHSGVPSGWGSPLTIKGCESNFLVDKPLAKEDENSLECGIFPAGCLNLEAGVLALGKDTFQPPRTSKAGINDVQLNIRPSESDVTIWDGLQAAHHLFRCRLYLRCITHPYDGAIPPDIRRIEMNFCTHPAGSRYAKPPVLLAAYTGASPDWLTGSNGLPNVDPANGIHIDRSWRTILNDDGTWGWYRDAFVPLSPRLFDKMDYRQFKLASRVWDGESCVEDELTFGISMLLRKLDMD